MQITDSEISKKVQEWLTPVFDAQTQEEIKQLQAKGSDELTESFYKDLEFGPEVCVV